MGPENMKEGELYFAVLQEDGTPGEWQKWEGFSKIEVDLTPDPKLTLRQVINTLTKAQLSMLEYLLDTILKDGYFKYGMDFCRYDALMTELNEVQKEAANSLIEIARKEWLKNDGRN